MLKQIAAYFCLITLIVSCGDSQGVKKPDNLIPKDKMVDIIIDARLVASANGTNKRVLEEKGFDLKHYVFKKHGIDSLQFALSNDYYAYHVKEYQKIFDKAIDSLNELKNILQKRQEKEEKARRKKELDSMKAIEKKKDSIKTSKENKIKKEKGILIKPASEKDSLSH